MFILLIYQHIVSNLKISTHNKSQNLKYTEGEFVWFD